MPQTQCGAHYNRYYLSIKSYTYINHSKRYNAAMPDTPKTVAEIDAFVSLLKAACNDEKVNATLRRLLEMPDARRQGVVHAWVTDLLIDGAPREFTQAVACLMDDAIAERAYEAVFECRRVNAAEQQ
jgi:hypothetical protein